MSDMPEAMFWGADESDVAAALPAQRDWRAIAIILRARTLELEARVAELERRAGE